MRLGIRASALQLLARCPGLSICSIRAPLLGWLAPGRLHPKTPIPAPATPSTKFVSLIPSQTLLSNACFCYSRWNGTLSAARQDGWVSAEIPLSFLLSPSLFTSR